MPTEPFIIVYFNKADPFICGIGKVEKQKVLYVEDTRMNKFA